MFVSDPFDDPNDHRRLFAGSIGDDLSKVIMVGIFQLVFNDDLPACSFFGRKKIDGKVPDGRLPFFEIDIDPDGLAQYGKIFILRQPYRKIPRLIRSYFAQVFYPFDFS